MNMNFDGVYIYFILRNSTVIHILKRINRIFDFLTKGLYVEIR